MLQASSSGGYIFILLSFGKLEMYLHALESWRCILRTPELWKAGDEPLGFRKLEMRL
jgi:hypothetical protein